MLTDSGVKVRRFAAAIAASCVIGIGIGAGPVLAQDQHSGGVPPSLGPFEPGAPPVVEPEAPPVVEPEAPPVVEPEPAVAPGTAVAPETPAAEVGGVTVTRGGGLPLTGGDVAGLVIAGAVLVGAGSAVAASARRRSARVPA